MGFILDIQQWRKKTKFNGSLFELEDVINEDHINRNAQYVVLSIGVNDVDVKSAEEVFQQLRVIVDLIRRRYGEPKMVIGELTPRRDQRDEEVRKCNALIKAFTDEHEYLFLAKQHKLRTRDWRHYRDDKHITQFASPLFVSSLKNSLRVAYGIPRRSHMNNTNPRGGFNGRGRGFVRRGRGNGRGRGGFANRQGGHNVHGSMNAAPAGFDFRNEFEKFKQEIRTIVTDHQGSGS